MKILLIVCTFAVSMVVSLALALETCGKHMID